MVKVWGKKINVVRVRGRLGFYGSETIVGMVTMIQIRLGADFDKPERWRTLHSCFQKISDFDLQNQSPFHHFSLY